MAISWSEFGNNAYVNMPSPLGTVYATGASINFTIPTVQATLSGTYVSSPFYVGLGRVYTQGSGWSSYGAGLILKYGSSQLKYLTANSTGQTSAGNYINLTWAESATVSLTTSNYFNSSNSTTRSVTFNLVAPSGCSATTYNTSYQGGTSCTNGTERTLSTITVTLNVPPAYTLSALSTDTPYIYTGLTTASVTVSSLSAKYGGTITDATLTIGNQTASRTDNGTLSILLNAVGTFTPTVTVTDSRGQTTTKTLDPITVNGYVAPSLSFDVERTTSTGTPDDEGAYATVDATLTFTDVVADAVAPTIVVTDNDGVAQTVSTTWYSTRASDGTLSGSVTWANVSSGDTVYGLVSITGGFNTQKSYEIALTPEDSQSTGTTITQTLATAFYTLDFLAGGHGIAFGKPAINTGFECAMDATFEETLTAQDMTQQEVDDFVDNIGGGGSPIADKVVEQGISGIWAYRKWNSGIVECWGRTSISGLTTSVNLPFTFADNSYETQVTLINNSNTATNVTAITNYTASVSIGVNTVPSGGARLFIIGRWK